MDHLKAKVDCRSRLHLHPPLFSNRDFHDFCERCELADIKVPVIAGILSVTSLACQRRMAERESQHV